MTQIVTDLLALTPATPGVAPDASSIDGAATGSFAQLLSDAALGPDTLSGVLEPDAALPATAEGGPLLLTLPPTPGSTEAEFAGNDGNSLPATGNGLPPDLALQPLTGETGESAIEPVLSHGEVSVTNVLEPEAPHPQADEPAPPLDTEAAALVPPTRPTPLDEPLVLATDVARSANLPGAVAESAARAVRIEPGLTDRPVVPAPAPATADEPVPPTTPIEITGKPGAAVAEVAAIEAMARPDATVRAMPVDAATGSAPHDLLARIAPLDSGGAARGPMLETPVRMTLDQPVTSAGWADALGKRVLVMTDTRIRSAEIRMDPPELGPIEVQLTVKDEKAHVAFQAQHALTRDAIELAMPRLREMLAEQGLVLGQATVSDQSAGEGGRFSQDGSEPGRVDEAGAGEMDEVSLTRRSAAHAGLIDEYA